MATQINWKDLEDRLQRAKSTVETTGQNLPKGGYVPVYICWPSEEPQSSKKDEGIGKIVAVMVGVLMGGLALGLLMARFMLPW